jgi:hypothetical protein
MSAAVVDMTVETVSTPYALIALYTPVTKGKSIRRWFRVG